MIALLEGEADLQISFEAGDGQELLLQLKIVEPFSDILLPDLKTGFEITTREQEVLQLICEEYTTPEIAEKLYISPRTVDGHRNNLLQKLGCRNVAGLVVFALQQQLVSIKPETFWFRKR